MVPGLGNCDICAWQKNLLSLFSKFLGKILDSFELQKFQTQNMKEMVKDKKFDIAVTYDMTFVRRKRFRFHCFQNFSGKFWTLSNFRNFGLKIQKRRRKIKKLISQLPMTWHLCETKYFPGVKISRENFELFQTSEISDSKYKSNGER
jgi:hypothetical protein